MEKKKKIVVAVSGLLVGTLLVGFVGGGMGSRMAQGGGGAPGASTIRTVPLERGDIQSTVSTTGSIYSTNSVNVYSTLNYSVKTVLVSVGDKVSEGDILAELDTTSLEADISQKQAQVSSNQATAQQNLKKAQQDLSSYENNVEGNLDSSLLSAEKAVASAEADLAAAELDIQSANSDLSTANRNYYNARKGVDDKEYTDLELRNLLNTVMQKEIALEKAQNTLVRREADLESAKASLDAARNSSNDTARNYQNQVTSAQLNNNFNADQISIEKLQSDLEKCTITAPASGTVTAVNAIEGGSGSGLLFVIQDTEQLKVITNIKEYDIASVRVGDKVIIKTDATGDRGFEGTLSKIAPTSTLTATGNTTSSTDAEFEAEVKVAKGSDGLLIGMNARLNIVTEEKKGVFSVPFEAVETLGGQSFVYIQKIAEGGGETYERIAVETGLETNLYVEISGDALEEGMLAVKNASGLDKSLVADSNIPAGAGGPPQSGEGMSRPEGVPQ